MNKRDVYNQGYNIGYDIASDSTNFLDPKNFNNADVEQFISSCINTESGHYRQFSPFEFFAHDINQCPNADSLWSAYDDGVYAGIAKRVKEFKRDNRKGFKNQ